MAERGMARGGGGPSGESVTVLWLRGGRPEGERVKW